MRKLNFLKVLITLLPFYLITLFFPSSVLAAKFTLSPDDYEIKKGQVFQVQVNLDTEGKKVSGIDLVFEYPKELVRLDKIEWGDIFEEEFINTNIKGKLSLSAARKYDNQFFQGSAKLLNLTLSTQNQGTANLNFVCQESKTDETNIVDLETGNDLVDCGQLHKGIYVVHEKEWSEEEETVCQKAPLTPSNLKATSGPSDGTVTLSWSKAEGADFYTISYGLISGNYIYGSPNVGDVYQYIVRQLTAGKVYYFVITSVNNCGSAGYSQEVWAKAFGAPKVSPGPTIEPEVVEYFPLKEIVASPSATPEPTVTPEPSVFADVEPPKETKFPFWLKYLAIFAGVGLFFIVVVQELVSAIKKRRKPPEPPVIDQGGPREVPAVQTEEEPQELPGETDDRPPRPFIEQPPASGSSSSGTNKAPWNLPM